MTDDDVEIKLYKTTALIAEWILLHISLIFDEVENEGKSVIEAVSQIRDITKPIVYYD